MATYSSTHARVLRHVPSGAFDAFRRPRVAAFIVEPVQGNGVIIPDEGYLQAALDLCRKYGTLFIADEI